MGILSIYIIGVLQRVAWSHHCKTLNNKKKAGGGGGGGEVKELKNI